MVTDDGVEVTTPTARHARARQTRLASAVIALTYAEPMAPRGSPRGPAWRSGQVRPQRNSTWGAGRRPRAGTPLPHRRAARSHGATIHHFDSAQAADARLPPATEPSGAGARAHEGRAGAGAVHWRVDQARRFLFGMRAAGGSRRRIPSRRGRCGICAPHRQRAWSPGTRTRRGTWPATAPRAGKVSRRAAERQRSDAAVVAAGKATRHATRQ